MTKKDYKKIAEVIKNNVTIRGIICSNDFIKDLCLVFEKDNPKFDSFRFMNACDRYSNRTYN